MTALLLAFQLVHFFVCVFHKWICTKAKQYLQLQLLQNNTAVTLQIFGLSVAASCADSTSADSKSR